MTRGLRKVAIRVSPSGKSPTSPRRTHERYPFSRPRVIEEKRKRAIGRANMIAAAPLNRIPSFMKNPRRERLASAGLAVSVFVDILFLRHLCGVLRRRLLRIVQGGIRLPRILGTPRHKPGHYVCDFLIGH